MPQCGGQMLPVPELGVGMLDVCVRHVPRSSAVLRELHLQCRHTDPCLSFLPLFPLLLSSAPCTSCTV